MWKGLVVCRGNNHGGRRCTVTPEVRSEQNRVYYLKRKAEGTVGLRLTARGTTTNIPVIAAVASPYNNIPHLDEISSYLNKDLGDVCEFNFIAGIPVEGSIRNIYETAEAIEIASGIAKRLGDGFSTVFTTDAGTQFGCTVTSVRFVNIDRGEAKVVIKGEIFEGNGTHAGKFARTINYNENVGTTMEYETLEIVNRFQNQKVGSKLITHFDAATKATGINTVETLANVDVGGYAWAKAGYDWDFSSENHEEENMDCIGKIRNDLLNSVETIDDDGTKSSAKAEVINTMLERLDGEMDDPDYPTPFEIAMCGKEFADSDNLWAGKKALLNSSWYGVRKLHG